MDGFLAVDVLLADGLALPGGAGGGASTWLIVGMAVVAVLYLTVRPKKRDPLADRPFRPSLAQQRSLERDMQSVIVELSEMTRQMSAQLETRAAKLDALIREADAKLIELRDALARPPAATAEPPPLPPLRLARTVDDNPHSEDRWAEVYRLGEAGLSLQQIAQQLGRPTGEIELILALRPKSRPPADAPLERAALPIIAEA